MAATLKLYKRIVAVLVFLLLAVCVGLVVVAVRSTASGTCNTSSVNGGSKRGSCVSPYKQDTRLPKNPTVFQDLSSVEYHAVRDYMLKKSGLSIVPYAQANQTCNFIYLIELYIPKKSEVLAYLDGKGKKPTRKARVMVTNGAKSTPDVEEYLVEPLPNPTSHALLKMAGYSYPIPFATRPYTAMEEGELIKFLTNASRDCDVIFKESFGYRYHNCTTNCLIVLVDGPAASASNKERHTWVVFLRDQPGFNILPVPFEVLIDHADKHASNWKILQVSEL